MAKLPCPPEDWPRFSALLDEGLALRQADLPDWFATLDGEDARLRPFLASALLGEDNAETAVFLRQPALDDDMFAAGQRVGPYALMARLGEGGMGEVWRAARVDDGPKRDVALKLPHAAFLGAAFRRRFGRERDVLAALSHPAIAQLYEAGASADGHPYLALELIEGAPITAYCRDTAASLAQRVDLLRQVLAGLSYAHQRLIVHRDIKPSNVLVTAQGLVKLLDFGIAKLLGPEEDGEAALTQIGRPATPAYAAPEQLAGGAITVAADIYSAGVLLFELGTGVRPPPGLEGQDAPLASTRADTAAAGLPDRRTLQRQLRGDLDAIIARALAFDPAARYASAAAFDDDLASWRGGLPVQARRIGWAARSRKFVRRNRLGVALAGVLSVALIGGTAGIAWQARRAEAQAARATAIKDFMIALFEAGDPHGGAKRAEEMTARELLDRGADRAAAAFGNDLAARIELLGTLGQIYDTIDDGDRALQIRQRRLALTRQLKGDGDPAVLAGAMDLAETESGMLDYLSARAELDRVRQPIVDRFGTSSLEWARWLTQRANALRSVHGAHDEIVSDLDQATTIFAGSTLDPHDLTNVTEYLGSLYLLEIEQSDAEQYGAALASLARMRATMDRFMPQDPVEQLDYLYSLTNVLEHEGRLDAADAIYASIMRQAEHLVGRQSQVFQSALLHRAMLAGLRGDRDRAQALFDTAGTAMLEHGLAGRIHAGFLVTIGRGADAVKPLQAALARTRQRTQDEDTERRIELTLGAALAQAGRTAEARDMLHAARDAFVQWGVPGTAITLEAELRWADFQIAQGEIAPGVADLRAVLVQSRGVPSAPAALAQASLADAARAAGDLRQADTASAAAQRLIDAVTEEYDVRARIAVWLTRAEVLRALGRQEDARALAARAAAAADAADAPGSALRLRARTLLAD